MFSRVIGLLIFQVFLFLHFSKAQDISILGPDNKPLEGVIVTYQEINGKGQEIFFSDFSGKVKNPSLSYPVQLTASMIGFNRFCDTLYSSMDIPSIIMRRTALDLNEVTITGNYMPGYADSSVYAVRIIGRQEIERKAANNLKDLLGQELNIKVSNDPALGSGLSIQGNGGEHIKFLIDGVPVIGRQNGNIDIAQLNLSNIERVEIIKGPMSVLYGTDALGGVINLISKSNSTPKFSGGLNGFYETNGQYNTDFTAGWGFKKSSVTVNGGRNFFDGWSEEESGRYQDWKPKEQYQGDIKFTRNFNKTKLTLQSGYFQEKVINKTNPVITPYYANAIDQYYHTRRFNNQVFTETRLSEKGQLLFSGAYSHYSYIKNTYIKNLVNLTEQLTPDELDDDTTEFNALFGRLVYNTSFYKDRILLISGIEFNQETANGRRIDGEEHQLTDIAAFASFEYKPVDKIIIRPSLRVIKNSEYEAPVIPSLNIMYKPDKISTYRASWSTGFRAPSMKEQYLNFVDNGIHNVQGNRDLEAEHSYHLQASAEWKKTWTKSVLTFGPSFFYNNISNRISLVERDASVALFQYINIDEYRSRGTETFIRFSRNAYRLQAGASYTGTDGSFETSEQPEIAWFAEFNASADYTINKTGTTVSAFWKYLGEKPVYLTDGANRTIRYISQDYQMMDFTIRQELMGRHLAVTLGVKNIFNVTNVKTMDTGGVHSSGDSESMIGTGTTFFTKISLKL